MQQRIKSPLRSSSAPAEGPTQTPANKVVTASGKSENESENPNLVSGLFFGSEIDSLQSPDLAKIVVAWPSLPDHIKAAIKALVQTHKEEQSK